MTLCCLHSTKEIAVFPAWLVWWLLVSPCLEPYKVSSTPVGNDTYHVRMVIQDSGWFPPYVSKKAPEKKQVRGVVCEIELPEGTALQLGTMREELGQLEGRAYQFSSQGGLRTVDPTDDRAKVEWAVHAPGGGVVRLTARHDRAGLVQAELEL